MFRLSSSLRKPKVFQITPRPLPRMPVLKESKMPRTTEPSSQSSNHRSSRTPAMPDRLLIDSISSPTRESLMKTNGKNKLRLKSQPRKSSPRDWRRKSRTRSRPERKSTMTSFRASRSLALREDLPTRRDGTMSTSPE